MVASQDTSPAVYVIAGPNGAGKTTFASDFLPDFVECREFLNADLIAAGLSPFAPEKQSIQAGKLLLKRIRQLAEAGENFSFETTLAGKGHARLLQDLKDRGYAVHLFFLWLPTVELAIQRVANRVSQHGHNIPEPVIRRRYTSGLRNLVRLYRPIVNRFWAYDGSVLPPQNQTTGEFSSELEAAMLAAAHRVLRVARETGTPVIVWEDGEIKHRSPDDFDLPEHPLKSRVEKPRPPRG